MSIRRGGCRGKGEPLSVIICEHDCDDPLRSHGAIILEQYTCDSELEVEERAMMFAKSGKHGRVWMAHIKVDDLKLVLA